MRYVYFANNRIGLHVLEYLVSVGDTPVALVVHPAGGAKFREEIAAASGLSSSQLFDGSALADPGMVAAIRRLEPDCGVSVFFDYILRPDLLALFPLGCVNLHPSLLPYNRGQWPNVWSLLDGTPSGVTLHYMDVGIDTGDIIDQREVPTAITDTGATLYRRLEDECLRLFRDTWPLFKAGKTGRKPQPSEVGSYHRTGDTASLDEIDLDRSYPARELLNLLRARTFAPYHGAYFIHEGRRIYVTIEFHQDSDR